ncbi:MAG: peptidase domain-containing ABC transporter [Xanthomonadales bacterium]|nr:peptidase domain-containing ABC transporter [Xanthomonadales bacterium]
MKVHELLRFSARPRVPVVLQNEVAECGLACLAMVAARHGHEVDLFALRRRFGVTLKGMTLKQLMATAEQLQLAPRALRVEPAALGQLRLPAVLHWNLNHFVVLVGVGKGRYRIHDPARGARNVDAAELSRGFSGVALELTPTRAFRPERSTTPLRLSQLWGSASGLEGSLVQIVLLALAIQGFALLLPYFLQLTLDQVLVAGDRPLLALLGIGFAVLTVVKVAAEALRGWAVLYLGSALNLQLGANVMRHLLRLPLEFFQKRQVGDLQSRVNALNPVRETLTGGLIEGVVDGVMALSTLALMLAYSPRLCAVAVAATLLYAGTRLWWFHGLRETTLDAIVRRARAESQFLESLRAMLPIKVFGRELERHAVWTGLQAEAVNAEARSRRLQLGYQAVQGVTSGLESVALVWLGALAVLDGEISVGMLMGFLAYRQLFSARCTNLIDKLLDYRMLGLHLSRLADIVFSDPEAHHDGPGLARAGVRGELVLRDVGFRYGEDEPWLFRHLNLRIRAGECVAFAGRSGQGKTTLIKIMMGLIEPGEGEVLLDGIDIRRIGLGPYRALCAAVMQEDQLIGGSLRDNITFQDPQPDPARLELAAELAGIREEIAQLPMGFESLIGDMGGALSGGQQQRVLLARALYAEPRLLFLDEATSALDAATEQRVNGNVRRLGITRVMIAHRRETLALADRVLDLAELQRDAARAA